MCLLHSASLDRLLLLLLGIAVAAIAGLAAADAKDSSPRRTWPSVTYPSNAAVREAAEFAAGRGSVSFAVIDDDRRTRGYGTDTHYSSASASKALLLAAELRRLRAEHEPLDSETRALLEPMITYSDNDAASGIYARVGDGGLEEVAEHAGMRDFGLDPGFWGGAQLTAADLARFYWRLERNLAGPNRDYAMNLLANVTETQRWGIPAAAGRDWRVWFKGGWRPAGQEGTTGAVTHQGALLVHRNGERLALAVLSNEAPGSGGGYTAIEGVTSRLLENPPPSAAGWPVP
jgi:beta-lactamase class A